MNLMPGRPKGCLTRIVVGDNATWLLYKRIRESLAEELGYPMPYKTWRAILDNMGKALWEELFTTGSVTLPFRLVSFTITKYMPRSTIQNGKLSVCRPVDWKATRELWENDEEARENRTILRRTDPVFFKLRSGCGRWTHNFCYFQFYPNNTYVRELYRRVNKGLITDAIDDIFINKTYIR